MAKAVIQLETLACPSCMQKIEAAVKGVKGINKDTVKVLFNASKVKTEFDENQVDIATINQAIEALGYPVIKASVK